ncbi:MAG: hypothetical protein ACRDSP_09540 [Pseudonocardiaceae bacterium]
MDHEGDDYPAESAGLFSAGDGRIDTEDGHAIIVHTDRATELTTLDLVDSDGVLLGSHVLGADDIQRLQDALTAAREHAREFDVPVVLDVSAVLGRD